MLLSWRLSAAVSGGGGDMASQHRPQHSGPTSLSRCLDGEHWEIKEKLRHYIGENELFNLRFDLPLSAYREVTLQRAKCLLKFPDVQAQFDDQVGHRNGYMNKNLAIGDVGSATDLSVGVKMGVMAWLFGGAVINLGTEKHIEQYFMPLQELKFTGMFAMSERGHGSNVRQLQTEAHYDPGAQEFVINTPCEDAQKIYIGNALQGNYACVFAQLIVDRKSKGPHAFIVPIRDENGLFPGITVTDMGLKEGLNGVDNGMLSFDHVRIPRNNLLNRYAEVMPSGEYNTSIQSDGKRFNAMLAAMIGTRLALAFQGTTSMKVGLEIAIRYCLKRRQFGPNGGPEYAILDYQTQQVRLMPHLATCLGLLFAQRYAGEIMDTEYNEKKELLDNRYLQALTSALKAYSTWENIKCLQTCRELCGGMGYMAENRLASLKTDSDVFVTFDGDNMVLMQQVAREMLDHYSQQFGGSKIKGMLTFIAGGLWNSVQTSMFAVNIHPITDVQFILKALMFREGKQLRTLAARLLNKVSTKKEEPFSAWNSCQQHAVTMAMSFVQRVVLQQFMAAVEKCQYRGDREVLQKFCRLYALHCLYSDRGWFLEQGYISSTHTKEIRDMYLKMCSESKEVALQVVEAFRLPRNCVHAPIAGIPSEIAPWAYYPENGGTSRQSQPSDKQQGTTKSQHIQSRL
ncbi:acyl-coenzyme A oxidase-like protein [Ptychodera flava]|uniref:acyl-coenzyme A oxidase-like protein n=1 Tax=Ptychodera flava TaxID=63121 RepID=UPI00396A7BE7